MPTLPLVIDDNDDGDALSIDSEDHGGSDYGGSESKCTTTTSVSGGGDVAEHRERLVQRESSQVLKLKILVLVVMILAAVLVSVVVYWVVKDAENEEFESQAAAVTQQVVDLFQKRFRATLRAVSSMVVATTGHGADHFKNWPFIALSWFQERSVVVLGHQALMVSLNPKVGSLEREDWEDYILNDPFDRAWYEDGVAIQEDAEFENFGLSPRILEESPYVSLDTELDVSGGMGSRIFVVNQAGEASVDGEAAEYLPTWQTSPVFGRTLVNENILQDTGASGPARASLASHTITFGGMESAPAGGVSDANPKTSFYAALLSVAEEQESVYEGDPMTRLYFPIFNSFDESAREIVGSMVTLVHWGDFFRDILSSNVKGIHVVLENTCGESYTYRVQGAEVEKVGEGSLHESKFDHLKAEFSSMNGIGKIEDGTTEGIMLNPEQCTYDISVYPSQEFYNTTVANKSIVVTFSVALVFVFTLAMFLLYDRLVERRQKIILMKAEQTNAIVSSLFPEAVRDRLMADQEDEQQSKKPGGRSSLPNGQNEVGYDMANNAKGRPNADLFPHATVLFADISGFTAWSSTRDPAQVFTLLEGIYNSFDRIAKKRKVFKVETIGDCYVAATGLPEPQEDHAVIMAKFASECITKMRHVTRDLETTLGPDTSDLSIRIGMHSGPVTAGVLRGERARFQLFGDTVNTAARMESTGARDKIQCSHYTADILTGAGKGHWLRRREDAVKAKGKGVLETFWIMPRGKNSVSAGTGTSSETSDRMEWSSSDEAAVLDKALEKQNRLVDWITELFAEHIKNILAKRKVKSLGKAVRPFHPAPGANGLDEVVERIPLSEFDEYSATGGSLGQAVEIGPMVLSQLHEYLSMIASTYHDNPFHNFEHACHVTMSVSKFLKRIVAPSLDLTTAKGKEVASKLHDYTHGITSDPIAQFAIVVSAVIHDADHRGVSNTQLIKENNELGNRYHNKSVAEQNSLTIGWDLLMSDKFSELRNCIFATDEEMQRFRQVLVNVVLATDIFDKEINAMRKERWSRAFTDSEDTAGHEPDHSLRATIVIEHIIQASDVVHTMQHWHIYRKWNKRLFHELMLAHRTGRMDADPATFWYKGELGFFDYYVIPLAKKLKECEVFGVNSDECLNYAMKNRAEWEARGEECVAEMLAELNAESPGAASR